MKFNFVPMNEKYANHLVDNWKYEGIYECYSYIYEKEHILEPSLWGVEIFAVLNDEGEMVGETTIEFYNEKKEYIERIPDNKENLANAAMWIGFQLRPNLTGKGLGPEFVQACVDFAVKINNYQGKSIRLAVYDFNERAIKAYTKAGFQPIDKTTNSSGRTVIFMEKVLLNETM